MDEQHLADLIARLDKQLRRFPSGTACTNCGQGNRLVLCSFRKQIVCQECRLKQQGRPPTELHHLGGRPSSLLFLVPANLHRLLTLLQELWRGTCEPGSNEAMLFDLCLLRIIGPSFGVDA
jgi:hypothetical protein